jgi:hypothetical protein
MLQLAVVLGRTDALVFALTMGLLDHRLELPPIAHYDSISISYIDKCGI